MKTSFVHGPIFCHVLCTPVMKAIHLVWMTGLISAPVAGWLTAMVKDADRGREVTAAKPVAAEVEPADQTAPPQPAAETERASPRPTDQEESRAKAELAKLLTAMQAPDANSAIENHALLKSQVSELTKARDVAASALYKSDTANSNRATKRIAELTRQLANERRAAEESRRQVASLEALRDAQGWHSPSCPACPSGSSTANLAPNDQQQQTLQQPAYVPIEFGQVIVCYP
jgi:hypothetical protein